jgi:hypothetical protein
MDKVQRPNNPECYAPSSEPFRIYIYALVIRGVLQGVFTSEFFKQSSVYTYVLHLYHSYYIPPWPIFIDSIIKIIISDEEGPIKYEVYIMLLQTSPVSCHFLYFPCK